MLDTIKLKSKGNVVKAAQYLFNYARIGEATETFTEDFKIYVISWQKKYGLTADGIIGKNTWTKLAKVLPTCSTSKNAKSVYTCGMQVLIGGIEVNGNYSTVTKNAVAAYQSACGLTADGICGPKTWDALIVKANTETTDVGSGGKVLNNCVKYLQWDSKWKNIKYSTHTSSQTIGNSGCGPTSAAMILATWYSSKITPVQTCEEAYKNGYRTYDSGTSWGYFSYVFKHYDCFSKYIETKSIATLEAAIREGALAVCSMNSNDGGFWTNGGHFIVARGVDDTYFYANDPNKSETPRKQKKEKFQSCLKQAFIYWPIVKEVAPEPKKEEETTPPVEEPIITNPVDEDTRFDMNLEGKIIDISKWQGNVDFSALKKEVGLVIARGSCGSDKDIKIDEYAEAMIKNRIPFAVYCYSYAGTVEKARDEAKKLVAYTEKYDPLFYIMDAEEAKITTDAIKAFADELRAQTCERIGCYVAHHRYNQYKYSTLQDLFDLTWIPCYGKNDGTIAGSKKPSYPCDLWQYTSTGKIAGIKGNVDMNVVMNDKKNLKWLLTGNEEESSENVG